MHALLLTLCLVPSLLRAAFDPWRNKLFPDSAGATRFEREGATIRAVALGPDGSIYVSGDFSSINGIPAATVARLRADGSLDESFRTPQIAGSVFALALQPDGRLLIGGRFVILDHTRALNALARLNPDGSLDEIFPRGGGGMTAGLCGRATVDALALAADGRIYVGGCFDGTIGVQELHSPGILRLHPDGTPDPSFAMDMLNGSVSEITVEPNGNVLIAGSFSRAGPFVANNILRIQPNGARDLAFVTGAGFDQAPSAIGCLSDGRFLVVGAFSSYNGTPANRVACLRSDGTIDTSYSLPAGLAAPGQIHALGDGRLLIAGTSPTVNGSTPAWIARLLADGSADPTFPNGAGFDAGITALTVRADGLIAAAGSFGAYRGQSRPGLAVIAANGDAIPTTTPVLYRPAEVTTSAATPDGAWIVGGDFTRAHGTARNGVARLHANGTLDESFVPDIPFTSVSGVAVDQNGYVYAGGTVSTGPDNTARKVRRITPGGLEDTTFQDVGAFDGPITAIAPLHDGSVVVAGWYSFFATTPANGLVRLSSDGTRHPTFSIGTGPDRALNALLPIGTDRLLVGGSMSSFNGVPCPGLAQLKLDGSVDVAFQAAHKAVTVTSLARQADGRLLVGAFDPLGAYWREGLVFRLAETGATDPTFAEISSTPYQGMGFDGGVSWVASHPDGSILVGGGFTRAEGFQAFGFARLKPGGQVDGIRDEGFALSGLSPTPLTTSGAVQADGRYLVTSPWTTLCDEPSYGALTFTPSRILNMSIRSMCGAADQTLIVGFVIHGDGSKPLLVRGIGPSLRRFGITNPVTDPAIHLFRNGTAGTIDENDDWGGSSSLVALGKRLGAFGVAPDSEDAMLELSLASGAYTVHLLSPDDAAIALVEAYDAEPGHSRKGLANISSRARVGTGDNILVLGFVIAGSNTQKLVIRGIGPTLSKYGVQDPLPHPWLSVHKHGVTEPLLATELWNGDPGVLEAMNAVHAFALPETSMDAVAVSVLRPGVYTVQVRGKNDMTGTALAEVYVSN